MESANFFKARNNIFVYNKKLKKNKRKAKITIIILSLIILILSIIIVYLLLNLNSQKGFSKEIIKNINGDNKYSTLKNQYYMQLEKVFDKYKNLIELNDIDKYKYKKRLLDGYSLLYHKQYTKIDTIVFDKRMNTGNALFSINNFIYFCEILGCKKIYLSQKYWFVKKPIYDKELDITISPLNNADSFDKETAIVIEEQTSFDKSIKLFINFSIPVRTYIIKDEVISNAKLKDMSDQDLIINIRSGKDVFPTNTYRPGSYHQPPLCFYQTIIENFNFTNIYIVANGMENPVINELLKSYHNIKYMHGTEEDDAGMILSAKNLVLATSSFAIELLKFNDNLKNVFFYDFLDEIDKSYWHFSENHWKPLKYNIFVMYPTKEYVEVMDPWDAKENQYKQMIDEKCNKKFTIFPSDFS